MLRAGTCYLEMFEFTAPPPASDKPLRPNDKGYTHFCVDCTDIEMEYDRLRGLGMTFGHPAPIDMPVQIAGYVNMDFLPASSST